MKNKTAIITGASDGIGKALAYRLAADGYSLGLTARRLDKLQELETELQKKYPAQNFISSVLDVQELNQCPPVINNIASKLGGLDLFIANAGIGFPTPAWKENAADVLSILQTNFMGAVATIEAAKEIMLRKKSGGHLVAISSVAFVRGLPASSAYCSSKSGLSTYLESIRIDLKHRNIHVTSIHPGFIATPMTSKNEYPMPFIISAEDAAQRILKTIELKKSRSVFPFPMKLMVWVLRFMPDCLYDFVMLRSAKKGVFR